MTNLNIHCPATGAVLDSGMELTVHNLARNWEMKASVMCPLCRVEHSGIVRELFTIDVLSAQPRDQSLSR